MKEPTRSALRQWMEFQLASVDAAELFEKLDHEVFVEPDSFEAMRLSEPALSKIDHARLYILATAKLYSNH